MKLKIVSVLLILTLFHLISAKSVRENEVKEIKKETVVVKAKEDVELRDKKKVEDEDDEEENKKKEMNDDKSKKSEDDEDEDDKKEKDKDEKKADSKKDEEDDKDDEGDDRKQKDKDEKKVDSKKDEEDDKDDEDNKKVPEKTVEEVKEPIVKEIMNNGQIVNAAKESEESHNHHNTKNGSESENVDTVYHHHHSLEDQGKNFTHAELHEHHHHHNETDHNQVNITIIHNHHQDVGNMTQKEQHLEYHHHHDDEHDKNNNLTQSELDEHHHHHIQSHKIVDKVVENKNKTTLGELVRKSNALKSKGKCGCGCNKSFKEKTDSYKQAKESIEILSELILNAIKNGLNSTNVNGTTNIIVAVARNVNITNEGQSLNFTSFGNGTVSIAKIADVKSFASLDEDD